MWISKVELRVKETKVGDKSNAKKKLDKQKTDKVDSIYFYHDNDGCLIKKEGNTTKFLSEAKKLIESFDNGE